MDAVVGDHRHRIGEDIILAAQCGDRLAILARWRGQRTGHAGAVIEQARRPRSNITYLLISTSAEIERWPTASNRRRIHSGAVPLVTPLIVRPKKVGAFGIVGAGRSVARYPDDRRDVERPGVPSPRSARCRARPCSPAGSGDVDHRIAGAAVIAKGVPPASVAVR